MMTLFAVPLSIVAIFQRRTNMDICGRPRILPDWTKTKENSSLTLTTGLFEEAICGLLLLPFLLQATEFYVSTKMVEGNPATDVLIRTATLTST